MIGLTLQNFFKQIVQDVAVGARKGLDQAGGILAPLCRDARLRRSSRLQGQRRHLQARDPSLGAGGQGGDVAGRKLQSHSPVKELGGLVGRKAQVGLAQFGHLTARSQAGKGPRRVGPAGDDQVHSRRQVLQQEGEPIVDALIGNRVKVVQDEDKATPQSCAVPGLAKGRGEIGNPGDLVDQAGQQRLDGERRLCIRHRGRTRSSRGLEHGQRGLTHGDSLRRGMYALHGRDKVGPEPYRVVVAFVERDPGNADAGFWPSAGAFSRGSPPRNRERRSKIGCPFAQQRRLAKAGWGTDERELAGKTIALLQATAVPKKPRV